jgi:signal transduction histidine kinase/CheY-like chemotaxis protein/HPt (histidine-containing phosphotransfer) domain-containing protein
MKKNRFIIFSVVLFLLILIAGSGIFIFFMQQVIRINKGNELTQLLEIERIKLETSVNGEIAIALKMAGSPLIQNYFAKPENSELEKIAFEEIAGYRRAFAANSVFWVNDKDKKFYSDDAYAFTIDINDPVNYWYKMTMYETDRYNFNINYNPDLNVTNLWINVPVLDSKRKPIGILGTGVNLSEFVNAVYESYANKAELYFFNVAGEITGAKNIELVTAKKNINEELSETDLDILANAKNLQPKEIQTLETKLGIIAIGTVPLLGWYSAVLMPDSISDYKTNITGLFIVMMVVMAIVFVIFNIFISGLLKPLRKTMDYLKATSKAKSDFLAKMSHEIRTPMNAITGMAELALRENIPNAAREHIITIKRAGTNLLSIINDLLDFSKIESGKLEIIPGNYQFSSLIHDVVSIIRMRVVDSNISFVVNIDCNVPNSLFGDETRIRQVLLNILSNAVKYTKKGFVSFSVSGEITEDLALLTIDVTDSGNGIKPEDLERLFDEFVQVDSATYKGVEGSGLGLAITKKLVNAMGGDISVASEYGKGSTFTITLSQKICSPEPLASIEKPEEKSVLVYEQNGIYADSIVCTVDNLGVICRRAESDEELRNKLQAADYTFLFVSYSLLGNAKGIMKELKSKTKIVALTEFGDAPTNINLDILVMPAHPISVMNILNGLSDQLSYSTNKNFTAARFSAPNARILIVDDIGTNLKVAEGLMLPYKMKIDLCFSGVDAIDAVTKNSYDLVFMDHMMPEMDGIEATKIIRKMSSKNPHYANLPIIALTANAVSGTKEMFLSNDFNDFLSKPIDTVKLNAILAKWLPKEKQEKLSEEATLSVIDSDSEAEKIEIDGVDVEKGIIMTGGTFENYMQTLATFHKDGFKKIEEIKKCLKTNNYHLYTTYVHALKSACASIGASDLSEQAEILEVAGKQENSKLIDSNNLQFLVSFKILLNNIGTVLNSFKKQETPVDFEALKSELCKLKNAFNAFDFGTINEIAGNLQRFAQAPEIGETVEGILQNTVAGKYEEAMTAIEELLGKILKW